ncbi:MAG: bifunctional DNA primase/polymerase [Clostridia bacterium]|jgi:hypothetical protein|nr:bifunctional DNA primase/polymerase [Clostridia bacterium]
MTDKPTKTTEAKSLIETAIQTGGVLVDSLDFSPITDTQRTAIDLHKRGLNVFPIPRGSKKPYILRPMFYSRLHRCGLSCKVQHAPSFKDLFDRQNIAVMLGRTSQNLFAIDCDTLADFRGMAAELDRRGLPYWAIGSARGGSYLMRLAEGEAKNKTLNGWQHVEIWGNKHFMILPPSIHPSGVIYQWASPEPYYNLPDREAPPLVSITALDWLGVEIHTTGARWEAPELLGLPDWTVNLSRANRRILARAMSGNIPEGARNIELHKPAYDIAALIDAGMIQYAEGWEVLEAAADAVGYPVKDARGSLRSALNKPDLTRARDGAKIIPKPYQQALAFAEAYSWPSGRAGHTDKAVFLACCERAKVDAGRGGSFRAASRETAHAANVSARTTVKVLRRLVRAGLLKYAGRDPSGANRYKFGEGYRSFPTNPTCSYSGEVTIPLKTDKLPQTEAQKDVFGRLGAVSWAVYSYLLENYGTGYKQIAKATGQKAGSVARVLSRGKNTGVLLLHGLVIYNAAEGNYHAEKATEDKLERIAAALYVLGRTAKRERQYQADRELRVNYLLAGAMRAYKPHE